ncbi:MAG: DUF3943 domain-containing protein [Candidatus Palauibacterales bacterium]|jgi:Domain of unknown function (DUF3943)|nr:DUF3943 domain-containing protein [Candidatus Palauibacterales bacterium]
MSTARGFGALIALAAACLATAGPSFGQEAVRAVDRPDGLGVGAYPSPLLDTPPLALRPLDASGAAPPGLETGLPGPQDDGAFCCDRRHFWPAIGEVGILLVVPWYFNRHVADDSTAVLSGDSWKRNIIEGMEWDRDAFKTNMWAHPYHGSTYFNSARGNGYDFWQSAAFSWGGSFLWETFGENNRPAINDWMSTALGGIALGETLHRFSVMIWDNSATGFGRTMRELGGFLVNPMGGFNRLVRGEWTKMGPNAEGRFPTTSAGALRAGYRWIGEGGRSEPSSGGFVSFDYLYGDAFKDFGSPFDAFEFTAQLYGNNEVQRLGLAHLSASLYGTELKRTEKADHVFHFAQHFDYVNIQTLETGGSSLSATFLSRWTLSDRWKLVTRFEPSALLIWGVDSEFSDFTQRDYDFGSGAGLRAHVDLRNSSGANVGLSYLLLWQHTLNGAIGDHVLQLGGIQAFVPIYRKLGLGATGFLNVRDSYYRDYPDVFRRNPEVRAYAAWSFE